MTTQIYRRCQSKRFPIWTFAHRVNAESFLPVLLEPVAERRWQEAVVVQSDETLERQRNNSRIGIKAKVRFVLESLADDCAIGILIRGAGILKEVPERSWIVRVQAGGPRA